MEQSPTGTRPSASAMSGAAVGAGSQAVDRAATLLNAIVTSTEPRTFTSLVDELGLAKSTTSRLLQALERGRLVQRDRSGSFRAGALFATYAARHNAAGDLTDLGELTQPVLDRLADATGETANFAIPRGGVVVQIAQADGHFLLGATNWVGVEVPPHCSALGKVFYAFGLLDVPDSPLEAHTPFTLTSPEALERDLAGVRRHGWASAWEELEVGLVAVAAPVRGPDAPHGTVVGAISISGPTGRITRDRLTALGELVAEHAAAASLLLGHVHHPRRRSPAGPSRKVGAA
jgi:DNA-binding IclR family transcriptional regulator